MAYEQIPISLNSLTDDDETMLSFYFNHRITCEYTRGSQNSEAHASWFASLVIAIEFAPMPLEGVYTDATADVRHLEAISSWEVGPTMKAKLCFSIPGVAIMEFRDHSAYADPWYGQETKPVHLMACRAFFEVFIVVEEI